jgi:hypothetical protein
MTVGMITYRKDLDQDAADPDYLDKLKIQLLEVTQASNVP